jgi:hypothetical protein
MLARIMALLCVLLVRGCRRGLRRGGAEQCRRERGGSGDGRHAFEKRPSSEVLAIGVSHRGPPELLDGLPRPLTGDLHLRLDFAA